MTQITKQQFLERLDNLPPSLQQALFDQVTGAIIWDISKKHHLSEEKIGIVADTVTDILAGFLHYSDLKKELQSSLNINSQITDAIAEEIEQKIISRYREDIIKVYNPVVTGVKTETEIKLPQPTKEVVEKTIPLEALSAPESAEQKIEISAAPTKTAEETKPLILHKEESLAEKAVAETKRPTIGGFQMFGGFFRGKKAAPREEGVRAAVEAPTPGTKKILGFIPKKEEKVVHYSEFRTPLAPFSRSEEFIKVPKEEVSADAPTSAAPPSAPNLPQKPETPAAPQIPPQIPPRPPATPKRSSPQTPASPMAEISLPQKPPAPPKTMETKKEPIKQKPKSGFLMGNVGGDQKNQPKIEGNIIDLR
jgi:hypothetical protein